MTRFVYVDNSNIYIDGCRIEAAKNGFEENIYEAMRNGTLDHDWQLDYGKLYEFLCEEGSVARLWSSLWDHAAAELANAASKLVSLNKWHDHISFKRDK